MAMIMYMVIKTGEVKQKKHLNKLKLSNTYEKLMYSIHNYTVTEIGEALYNYKNCFTFEVSEHYSKYLTN